MGGEKDKAPKPKRQTPLPPPRALPALTNEQRELRAESADLYRSHFDQVTIDPIHFSHTRTLASVRLGLLGPRISVRKTTSYSQIFHLGGHSTFDPPDDIRDALWPDPDVPIAIPVMFEDFSTGKFAEFAKGYLSVKRTKQGRFETDGPQLLLFNHPALPVYSGSEIPMLRVEFHDSAITGKLVLAKDPAGPNGFLQVAVREIDATSATALLGLEDLHDLKSGGFKNELVRGALQFELTDLAYKFQGVFPGRGSFSIAKNLDGVADVEAKGLSKATIKLARDEDGKISAEAKLRGELQPRAGHKLEGDLRATFSRGAFDIDGTLAYRWSSNHPKVDGNVRVRVTDLATARAAVRQRLGKFAPEDPEGDSAPNGLALWGEGEVSFSLNSWLTGRANVVVDPDGFLTVLGELRPQKRIEVFSAWSPPMKDYFSAAGRLVEFASMIANTRIGLGGSVTLTPSGSIGPGTIEDIQLDGVFTTYPKERLASQFTIAGTFVVPAKLSLTLSASVEVSAAGRVGAGLRATGTAELNARGSVTPKIGLEVPNGETDPRFFIAGRLTAQATLDLSVEVGCYAYLDTVFWREEVAYTPVKKTFRLGSTALSVVGKYYFGKPSQPERTLYDINARQPGGPKHEGFNNDHFTHKAIHKRFDDERQTASRTTWIPESYRAARSAQDIVPSEGEAESAISTQSLAAGGAQPYESADENATTAAAPTTTPPASIAAAPSTAIGGGSSTPPPHPPTPDPQQPSDPQALQPPGLQPPAQAPGLQPPDPQPPTQQPQTPPPPPPPQAPPPATPSSPEPLRETFKMLEQDHVLLLYRLPPAHIIMEPIPDRLRFKLRVTEIVLKRELDMARTGNRPRSVNELEAELRALDRLESSCDAVERAVRDLEDPLDLPTHVVGFESLADDLEAYGAMFGRPDLFDESFLRATPSPPPGNLPVQYQDSQVLRQLERAEPGKVNEFLAAHGRYLGKFNSTNRTKPTKTPMGERDYLEMRARFRLGMKAEEPALDIYNRVTGQSISKNNFTVDILDRRTKTKERGRKPDLFELGVVIGDVKNVGDQDYSEQMRDNFRIAAADDVRVSAGIAGTRGGRILVPSVAGDLTPRFDLIIRVPWHPRGQTAVHPELERDIKRHGNGSDILELIDDPVE